jgi:hypothetical protein
MLRGLDPTLSALAHRGAIRPNFGKSGAVLLYIVDSKQAKGKNSSRNQPNTLATTDPPLMTYQCVIC